MPITQELLQRFELTDRRITEENDLEQIAARPINFDRIDALREKEKSLSVEYLKNALSDR